MLIPSVVLPSSSASSAHWSYPASNHCVGVVIHKAVAFLAVFSLLPTLRSPTLRSLFLAPHSSLLSSLTTLHQAPSSLFSRSTRLFHHSSLAPHLSPLISLVSLIRHDLTVRSVLTATSTRTPPTTNTRSSVLDSPLLLHRGCYRWLYWVMRRRVLIRLCIKQRQDVVRG